MSLEEVFRKYGCHTRTPTKSEFNDLKFHLKKKHFELCIMKYPEEFTIILLKYFELKEMYETCALIKKLLEEESLKTNLQKC